MLNRVGCPLRYLLSRLAYVEPRSSVSIRAVQVADSARLEHIGTTEGTILHYTLTAPFEGTLAENLRPIFVFLVRNVPKHTAFSPTDN